MKRIEFNIAKRLSEVEESLLIERDGTVVIKSPTDSGKTYTHINYFYKSNNSYLFLVPTVALLNDIKAKYEAKDGVAIGSGFDFLNANRNTKTLITTYDSIKSDTINSYRFKRVYIDEAHLIAGHASFRDVCTQLIDWHKNTTYITATPETIDRLTVDYFIDINFITPRDTLIDIVRNTTANNELNQAIWIIQKNLTDEKQTIININNKKTLEALYEHFESTANMVVLKSFRHIEELTGGQNKEHIKSVLKGELPKDVDVLLTTSVLYAGVSLKTYKDVYAYMLTGNRMPHPVDAIQFAARVRSNEDGYKLHLTIQGKYGNYEKQNNKVQYSNKEQTSNALETEYETYQSLNESDYTSILNKYSLYPDYKLSEVSCEPTEALKSNVGDISIVRSLHTFSRYSQLKDKCYMLGLSTEVFEQENFSHSNGKKFTQRVNRIVDTLEKAVEYAIPFEWFVGDKLDSTRVETLVSIREIIRNTKDKAIVMNCCQWLDSDTFRIDWNEIDKLSTTAAKDTYKKFLGYISTFSRKKSDTKKHTVVNRDTLKAYMQCLKDEYNTMDLFFSE